ncbi:hypothetical protein JOQ06_001697, partial [Pogonophryne albipinna]
MTLCLALEDVEALYLGPSFLTADPMGPLLDHEDEDPLPWLLHAPTGAEHCSDDAFAGMDWMSEKIDLSELDLQSLIGSDDSPEELLASLDPHLDLEAFHSSLPLPLDLPLDAFHSSLPLPLDLPLDAFHSSLPLPLDLPLEEELALKSEPPSPAFTLDLGCEVDVLDVLSSPVVLPSPPPSGHMLVVNALPDQPIKTSPPSSDSESDSGIESFTDSPPRLLSSPPTPTLSSRTKPEECEELMKKNEALEERAEAISREIKYLTELMEEVRRHRNKSKAPEPPSQELQVQKGPRHLHQSL